jgi:squalene-hopene/tetraprenyl-beta-curcumene cyclase
LRVLQAIQPTNGGFLEATPLTGFVVLGLASSGQAVHAVVKKCIEFLVRSVRADGSWPIDSNLSTWVTTLAVNALAAAGDLRQLGRRDEIHAWLISQQYKQWHPYTGATPGGWAWTPLPGGVPDGDDTPGALLALRNLDDLNSEDGRPYDYEKHPVIDAAEDRGLQWLAELQNRDGGWPTFCRGWGTLPFDRSGTDLTAHALRVVVPSVSAFTEQRRAEFSRRGFAYLARTQRADGSWLPLWFGCQHGPEDANPTYGAARVLAAYRDLDRMNEEPAQRGVRFLLTIQNADGGWGGAADTPSSVEETALAVEVLLDAGPSAEPAVNRGLAWLVEQVEAGGLHNPTPIGFYFAKLWYFEKLYPIIFTVAALGRARRKLFPAIRGTTPAASP